ncbi:hypothetical protein DL768_010998 [Monosporascus sp. mg162]|nr:hypothetical protein DL768_010998 [Monosporascus sp. mg162]
MEIPDGKLGEAFLRLETHIQALVQDHFRYKVEEGTAKAIAVGRWTSAFPSEVWSLKTLRKSAWFSKLVANLIHAELFDTPFFGCEEESVERGLVEFEKFVLGDGRYPGYTEEIVWWRILTMEIIGNLFRYARPEKRDPEICERLAKKFKPEFLPIFEQSGRAEEKLAKVYGTEVRIFGARLGGKRTLGTGQGYKVVFSVFGPVVKEYKVTEDAKIYQGQTNILPVVAVVE